MSFIKTKAHDQEKPKPNVLKKFYFYYTLRGFKLLRKYLQQLGFNSFVTRNFNKDPLENFFCQVRQHAGRNINSTRSNFSTYYKSLLINSCTRYMSPGSNCEDTHF